MPPRRRMFHSFSVKNYTMQTPVWQPQSGREFANNGRLCYTYFAFAKFTAGFSEKGASAMGQPLWLNFTARPEEAGLTLRNFLRQQGVSASLIKGVKYRGEGFLVDGRAVFTDHRMEAGETVRFALPPEEETTVPPQDLPIELVYEDAHTALVNKPAGMTVHPTLNAADGTLANAWMGLLHRRGETGVFRPVNRIDRDTSGLVLCAKNAYAAAALARNVQKVYLAVLQGVPARLQGEIDAPIDRASGSIILRQVGPQGKPSRTGYRVLAAGQGLSLVAARPITGRTHQLRVHFAHIGCPLAGDELYGGSRAHIGRQALHCARMTFASPGAEGVQTVDCPLPPDMAALCETMTKL